jgi:hypothetical protein
MKNIAQNMSLRENSNEKFEPCHVTVSPEERAQLNFASASARRYDQTEFYMRALLYLFILYRLGLLMSDVTVQTL